MLSTSFQILTGVDVLMIMRCHKKVILILAKVCSLIQGHQTNSPGGGKWIGIYGCGLVRTYRGLPRPASNSQTWLQENPHTSLYCGGGGGGLSTPIEQGVLHRTGVWEGKV
jgi:hypothetical protein